ncbi:MAG: ABC1 kinase family protein [Acidimicrobiales bacterium]
MPFKISQAGRYAAVAHLIVRHGPALRSGAEEPNGSPDPHAERDAAQLAEDLESMGPTFVKLGQLLSTRSDLLPPSHLLALGRLQDDVEPFPSELVTGIFKEELGVSIKDAFESFEPIPIASASLGQVYRAKLRDGRPVVVKVQRPDIEVQVRDDLSALGDLARFVDQHTDAGRRYGFADLLDQFRRALTQELDYEQEAAHLIRLATILKGHKLIVVPSPIPDFTSRRILTMEDISGRKVTDLSPLARLNVDGPALAEALFSAYLDQIFVAGFFHADPHPGNVLITPDGRIGLIDLGMVGHLRTEVRTELVKLVMAIAEGKGEEAARVLCSLGRPLDDFDQSQMLQRVSELLEGSGDLTIGRAHVGQLLADLSRECGNCGLRPPPELSMLARALLNLDAVTKELAPDFNPSEAIRSGADRLLTSQMDPSPGDLIGSLVDAKNFAEQLPGRAGRLLDALASGDFRVNVHAFDEAELLRGIQKVANRVTMGLVIAALVLGASVMSHSYPRVALGCFIGAGVCGIALVVSVLLADRQVNSQTRRRRR